MAIASSCDDGDVNPTSAIEMDVDWSNVSIGVETSTEIKSDQLLKNLRRDSRYRQLLHKMRLPT